MGKEKRGAKSGWEDARGEKRGKGMCNEGKWKTRMSEEKKMRRKMQERGSRGNANGGRDEKGGCKMLMKWKWVCKSRPGKMGNEDGGGAKIKWEGAGVGEWEEGCKQRETRAHWWKLSIAGGQGDAKLEESVQETDHQQGPEIFSVAWRKWPSKGEMMWGVVKRNYRG